ncbi:MAG TPA: hypothetical protein VG796_03650 [Verrucomicrobiales bacterium]|nr:hypothetical protein [Verrucomicrobiales bacterium]
MKILCAALLVLTSILTVRSTEVRWEEKEIYTVSEKAGTEPALVKVKVVTPDLTGYAGFFCEGHDASKAVRGIKTAGITRGRIDAWEKEEIDVPQKYLDAALGPKDPWSQSLFITSDPTHRTTAPLCQWGHSLYIILKTEKRGKIIIHPNKTWTGFKLGSCAPEAQENQLPIVYSRITAPSQNGATDFVGLLNVETGVVSEILPASDSDLWALTPAQLSWISSQQLAVTSSSRYGESCAIVDLEKKKITTRQYIPGAARWLIADGQLHVWLLHPGAITISSKE